jgi:formylmethanofuran dehydrogenase subunit B
MTSPPVDATAGTSPWVCPFCALLCDGFGVDAQADALALTGSDCPRARAGLTQFTSAPSGAQPLLDGTPCAPAAAITAAAHMLAASRQPLFGGLGTDVAGARALYPLACATGAITDPVGGAALMQGVRALQDRGQFTTTFAEVRTRADVIVFLGGIPVDIAPLIGVRCGIGEAQVAARHVAVIGATATDAAVLGAWAGAGVTTEALPLEADLFTTTARLAAQVAGRLTEAAPPALRALAQRLQAARYAVIVGAPSRLPAHGALVIEAVNRIVGTLNATTRAASLWVGSGAGPATVNQVFTWLSGLPLRTRCGPRGLEHEPFVYDTDRLLTQGGIDAVLWVASFTAADPPPSSDLPMVVLGHPALAAACAGRAATTVFIPVATPGIGSGGHLFRTDGNVVMPLVPVRTDTLPSVAEVLGQLLRALPTERAA